MTGDDHTDDHDDVHSRRSFLRSTATTTTTAIAASATAASTSLAGCSALPGGGDDSPNPPEYDPEAVTELVREPFPKPPDAFPVDIPAARFQAHETRARELLEAIPEAPDIPNEAVAKRIARQRRDLTENLGEMYDEHTPRDRLGRWRYYRSQAAEVWGSYVAATAQYSPSDFRSRYGRLRTAYNSFEGNWEYRGSNLASALVVHHAIEELVSRGRDEVLRTGPFPTDPQAAVFEAGRMVRSHESAEASLEDARAFRSLYLASQSGPPSQRLAFANAIERLRHPATFERPRGPYEQALEEGPSALDADIGNGPAGAAFEHARRAANFTDDDIRQAIARNDPATATLQAARKRLAMRTFRAVVDAIHANDLGWPDAISALIARNDPATAALEAARRRLAIRTFQDVVDAIHANDLGWPDAISALHGLRGRTVQALESAWSTSPEPLAAELNAHAYGVLTELTYYYDDHELDDHDLARYVGTLYYARRYADGIPEVTTGVVDAISTK